MSRPTAVAVMIENMIIVSPGVKEGEPTPDFEWYRNASTYVPDGNASLFTGRASEVTEFVTNGVTESDASKFDGVLQKDCNAT